ncbi:MAG: hypothetical protein ACKOW8_02670 [Flavobacteriales bacterium]
MINLIILSCVTISSVWMQHKIYNYTRSYVLFLPVLAIYYWSILGGWFVTIDLLSGNALENVGFHYYSYFDKLFPIHLDNDYVESISYLSLFLLCFQLSLLNVVKRFHSTSQPKETSPLYINHWILMCCACCLAVLSYFFIRAQILEAVKHHESLYLYLSHQSGRFYSMYQVSKSASLFLILFGVSLLLSQNEGRYFTAKSSGYTVASYAVIALVLFVYATLIGSRSDLLFAFLFSILFYLVNARKVSFFRLSAQLFSLALIVVIIEMTRAIPIMDYLGLSVGPGIPNDEVLNRMSFISTFLSLLSSNEMFAGHMSMYGAVFFDVPLTMGGSFNYLLHSLVPRFLVIDRPPDSYQHYVNHIHYTGVQGFTINHATGWYLNFGVVGIVMGGAFLGMLVGAGHVMLKRLSDQRAVVRIFLMMFLLTVCAFSPSLIRTGPEGIKALCLEAFLIPALLIFMVYWASSLVKNQMEKPSQNSGHK